MKSVGFRESLDVRRKSTNVQGLLIPEEVARWIRETPHKVEAANTTSGLTSEAS